MSKNVGLGSLWQGEFGRTIPEGFLTRPPTWATRRRSAGLRPGGSGAGSGNAAGPEAGAPVAASRCARFPMSVAKSLTDFHGGYLLLPVHNQSEKRHFASQVTEIN